MNVNKNQCPYQGVFHNRIFSGTNRAASAATTWHDKEIFTTPCSTKFFTQNPTKSLLSSPSLAKLPCVHQLAPGTPWGPGAL